MSDTANVNDGLFDGGPLLRWEPSLFRGKPGRRLARRTLLAVLIGWLPMAVLAAAQQVLSADESAKSFFFDFAVHARFLVALPALIFAEAECIPRLGRIVNHFAENLVAQSDTPRFQAAVTSTRRLLDSTTGSVVTLVLVYLVVATVQLYSLNALLAWQRGDSTNITRFSPAGLWNLLVSLPLLLVVFFGWLWRLALWGRFLYLMSRLDLHLIPSHPDRAGGLQFVSSSLRGFRLISFACGAIVAGTVANFQYHAGAQLIDFRNGVIGLLIVLLILFAGPLTIFFNKLRDTKTRAGFEYGALARAVGTQFEARWLRRQTGSIDQTSLEVPDFSATTDLYSVTANVYAMRRVPFSLKDLNPIVFAAMQPFLPLVLLAIPLETILEVLAKLLF